MSEFNHLQYQFPVFFKFYFSYVRCHHQGKCEVDYMGIYVEFFKSIIISKYKV